MASSVGEFGLGSLLADRFSSVIDFGLGLVTAGWVFARPEVFRALREVGVKVCPKCGYDLRGQSGDSCPECGWTASDDPDHAG